MKKLNIIYEDKELLVVEKESHQLTIATEKRENNTLYSEASTYVKKQYPKRTVRHSNNRPQQSANVKFNRNVHDNNQVSNQKPQSGVNKSSDKIRFESNDLLDDYKK